MRKISVIIPVYYNQENLPALYKNICDILFCNMQFIWEIVFVDDCSGDQSWAILESLASNDSRLKIVRLARNFGSHAAILCGLSYCTGDCAIIKAADLQEPTEMILEMIQKWIQGYNVVLALRKSREDKSLFSDLYYWLTQKVALPSMPKNGFDVFLLDRKAIEVLKSLDEKNSAITGQILWSGFKTEKIYYERVARKAGKSRWTLKKKLRLVSDTMFSFSTLPITLVTSVGALSFVGSIIWAVVVIAAKLMGKINITGWTTLFIFQLFSFSIIMLTLGVLGGYLWRTFDATRGRPVYIVEQEGPSQV